MDIAHFGSKISSSFSQSNFLSLNHGVSLRDQLQVSGQFDLNKPQFEGGNSLSNQVQGLSQNGEALSGPAMSEGASATHMAGLQRLFGDNTATFSGSQITASSTPVSSSVSQTLPLSSAQPSALNVNGSAFGQQVDAAPAVAHMNDLSQAATPAQNVSYNVDQMSKSAADSTTSASKFGPSGAVSDHLGAKTIADAKLSTFKPSMGTVDSGTGYDASYLQQQQPVSSTSNLEGLKAKALTLNDVKHSATSSVHAKPTAPSHSAAKPSIDHIGHYNPANGHQVASHSSVMDSIAHRVTHKVDYNPQPKTVTEPVNHAPGTQSAEGSSAAGADQQEIAQAAGADAQQAAPTAPSTYTIRAGDCLWNIAKDHLGNATRWSEIYKMNSDVIGANPSLIHPGTNLNLPGSGHEIASGLDAGTYSSESGDNLWNISKHYLGDGTKWTELYKANADVVGSNPNLIFPGQELHIPGAEGAAETVAQAPGASVQQIAANTAQSAPTSAAPSADFGSPAATDASAAALRQRPARKSGRRRRCCRANNTCRSIISTKRSGSTERITRRRSTACRTRSRSRRHSAGAAYSRRAFTAIHFQARHNSQLVTGTRPLSIPAQSKITFKSKASALQLHMVRCAV